MEEKEETQLGGGAGTSVVMVTAQLPDTRP